MMTVTTSDRARACASLSRNGASSSKRSSGATRFSYGSLIGLAGNYTLGANVTGVSGAYVGLDASSILAGGAPTIQSAGMGVSTTGGVGSYAITASGTAVGGIALNFVNAGTLTITPATLTVTANNDAKTYDGLAYTGGHGVSYSGFVNGETASVLGGTPVYGGLAQNAVNAGEYAISVTGLSAANYTIGYTDGKLTVGKAALTVTANYDAKTYDGLA
jgi:hypothetical protein